MFGFHEDAHDQVYGGKTHHSSWTHEMIAGAAAFEAMKSYEGQAGGSHQLSKEIFAGLAAAEADKLFETKGLDGLDRERAKAQAQQQAEALYDQKFS
ncbi:hypothetical protein BG000_003904 [Podila horticola]|nr:hypothetical protein BG003_000368 [Podila horticola]KAG0338485.1 hypothetical protein BG000_003904 [Podila horticola]